MGLDRQSANTDVDDRVAARLDDIVDDIRFACVFGSAATGNLTAESDYDLAVDAGRRLKPAELLELAASLEAVAGRPVDIVDLWAAGPILKMQVLRKGRLLLCHAPTAVAEFQMYTPKQYADWKRRRRPIEEALIHRIRS